MHVERISAYSRIALVVIYIIITYKFPRLMQSRIPKRCNREGSGKIKCIASHLRRERASGISVYISPNELVEAANNMDRTLPVSALQRPVLAVSGRFSA